MVLPDQVCFRVANQTSPTVRCRRTYRVDVAPLGSGDRPWSGAGP